MDILLPKQKMDWKEQIRDLKQQFEEFWEQQKPTKGGSLKCNTQQKINHQMIIYLSTISKRDLKHSRTFFRKNACDLGVAAYQIFYPKGPCGITLFLKRNIWNLDRNSNFPLFCHENNKIVLWVNDSGANLHGFLRRFWIRYPNKI